MPKTNLIFGLLTSLLLLSAGVSRAQVTDAPVIRVCDGFETSYLSKVWDTDRFVPGAVQMQTNIFRAGRVAEVKQPQAWYRAWAGKLFGWGTKLLCIRGIADTQCGFKAMTRDAAQKILPQVTYDTAIFDIEMLVVAAREGYRIAEVPVKWVHDPDTRIPYNLRRALGIWGELFLSRRAQCVSWPLKVRK